MHITLFVTMYLIQVLCLVVGGEDRVADSPYIVRVLPQHPVTRKCTVMGAGRSRATAGEPAEFHIEGRDLYGNR